MRSAAVADSKLSDEVEGRITGAERFRLMWAGIKVGFVDGEFWRQPRGRVRVWGLSVL